MYQVEGTAGAEAQRQERASLWEEIGEWAFRWGRWPHGALKASWAQERWEGGERRG